MSSGKQAVCMCDGIVPLFRKRWNICEVTQAEILRSFDARSYAKVFHVGVKNAEASGLPHGKASPTVACEQILPRCLGCSSTVCKHASAMVELYRTWHTYSFIAVILDRARIKVYKSIIYVGIVIYIYIYIYVYIYAIS